MQTKKLKIGFTFNKSNGGPSNFLKTLKNTLEIEAIAKTSYFINPFTDCNIYANVVRNPFKRPFIFRIDGIAIDMKMDIKQKEKINKAIVHGLNKAQGVVFQSNFSEKLCKNILNYTPDKSTTILNGVDLTLFTSKGENKRNELNIEEDALVFISSAKWRKHKRLKDIIEVFKLYKQMSPQKCYLIIIGENHEVFKKNKNIIFIPHINRNEIPNYLRTANIYLFFSWLDNCPNSVIEAIACHIPVICTDQGGTKEIIKATNGGIIAEADLPFIFSEISLYEPPTPNYQSIIDAIKKLVNNYTTYSKQINTNKIDIKYVAKEYHNFINKTMKN